MRHGSGGEDRPAVSQALEVDRRATDIPVGRQRRVDWGVDQDDPRREAAPDELGGRVHLVVAGGERIASDDGGQVMIEIGVHVFTVGPGPKKEEAVERVETLNNPSTGGAQSSSSSPVPIR